MEEKNMEEFQEFVTFYVTDKDGNEVEMAVIDEFDYDHKHYVVSVLVEGEEINLDGMFIYKAKVMEEDFQVEKITDFKEYEEISNAYLKMDREERSKSRD